MRSSRLGGGGLSVEAKGGDLAVEYKTSGSIEGSDAMLLLCSDVVCCCVERGGLKVVVVFWVNVSFKGLQQSPSRSRLDSNTQRIGLLTRYGVQE